MHEEEEKVRGAQKIIGAFNESGKARFVDLRPSEDIITPVTSVSDIAPLQ